MATRGPTSERRSREKTIARGRIEVSMSDYEGFFDHAWARSVVDKVSADPAPDVATSDLMLALKSTSNAFRLPWLATETHSRFVTSFLNSRPSTPAELLTLIKRRLRSNVKSFADASVVDDVVSAASAMLLSLQGVRNEELAQAIADNAFSKYIEHSEFHLGVLGLMRNTFTSLVFAYENFFLACFRLQAGDPDAESAPANKFRDRVIEAFGESFASDVWTGDGIRRFFEVRNALAHRGGKSSRKLDRWKSQLEVMDGIIQITASDNRELFHEICWRVDRLIERVLARPIASRSQ